MHDPYKTKSENFKRFSVNEWYKIGNVCMLYEKSRATKSFTAPM